MPFAGGSLLWTLKMAGTCLCRCSTAAAPLRTLHIYVLIVLQPARPINVALFQLLEWRKYAMFPVSSAAYLCAGMQQVRKDGAQSCREELWTVHHSTLNLAHFFFLEHLTSTLGINDCVPALKDIEVVYISCIIADSLNTNCGPAEDGI